MPTKAGIITNKNIVRAIDRLLESRKITAKQLAKELNISEASMVGWRREGRPISVRCWEKLKPMLKPYLPASPDISSNAVPVFAVEDLLSLRPIVQSINDYARAHACAYAEIPAGYCRDISNMFQFRISDAAGGIPPDSVILCSCSAPPENGATVILVQDGTIHIGRFDSKGLVWIGVDSISVTSPTLLATVLSYTVIIQPPA